MKRSTINISKEIQPDKHPGQTTAIVLVVMAVLFMIPGVWLLIKKELAGSILLAMGLILLASLPAEIKKERYKNVIKARQCAQFTEAELAALQNELDHTQPTYGSFYMLNEYLFLHQHGILLRYTEIENVRTVERKKNGITQGVTIFFQGPEMEYDIFVVEWRKYLKDRFFFEGRLNEKRSQSLRIHAEKEHHFHMPHIDI